MSENVQVEPTVKPVVEPEIKTVEAPAVEIPMVKAVKEPEVVTTTAKKPAGISFEQKMNDIRKNGTLHQKALIQELENYIDKMAPGKLIGNDEGAHQQYVLWRSIYKITHTVPRDEFKALWNILLNYFNEYKNGVFDHRYIFRFAAHWGHSEVELFAFQRIINLIKLTADFSVAQKNLSQVNLIATLSEGFEEEARQRILSYYGK